MTMCTFPSDLPTLSRGDEASNISCRNIQFIGKHILYPALFYDGSAVFFFIAHAGFYQHLHASCRRISKIFLLRCKTQIGE